MNKTYFIIMVSGIYLLLIQAVFKNNLNELYDKYRSDSVTVSKLKYFEKNGYNRDLKFRNLTADKLITKAREYQGTPHCMGGTTKKCIDCSGLLYAVFKEFDIDLPHGSEEQARYGDFVMELGDLKEGDLVFFIKSYQTEKLITHAGIYLGNNAFIHASSKKGVVITTMKGNSYWEEKFIFATRIF